MTIRQLDKSNLENNNITGNKNLNNYGMLPTTVHFMILTMRKITFVILKGFLPGCYRPEINFLFF